MVLRDDAVTFETWVLNHAQSNAYTWLLPFYKPKRNSPCSLRLCGLCVQSGVATCDRDENQPGIFTINLLKFTLNFTII